MRRINQSAGHMLHHAIHLLNVGSDGIIYFLAATFLCS